MADLALTGAERRIANVRSTAWMLWFRGLTSPPLRSLST